MQYSYPKEIFRSFTAQENFVDLKQSFVDLVHAHFFISIAKKISGQKKHVFDM